MIGQIGTWTYTDTWNRSWDSDYPEQVYSNINFNFQSVDSNGQRTEIGRYESGSSQLKNGDLLETESTNERTSVTVYERVATTGEWDAAKLTYDLPASLSADQKTALGFDWDADVDRIEVSTNNDTYFPVGWREEIDTSSSTSVRFYSETAEAGGWYSSQFLGTMEFREGFVEVWDSEWTSVARLQDMSNTDAIKDWDFVKDNYDGIEEAWDNVKTFFASDDLKVASMLSFTVDDQNIYAFTATGVMIGQINYWSDTNEWTRWSEGGDLTVKNFNYNYNFHDADWNNLASSGGNERFIVDPTDVSGDTLLLDETSMNIGFTIAKADAGASWTNYDPNNAGTITFADVDEVRYSTNSWSAVENAYRTEDEIYADSNVSIQYFDNDLGGDTFVGAVEISDGFIKIRNSNWEAVSKVIDPASLGAGSTYNAMITKYGADFADAWTKLGASMPDVFKINTAANGETPVYETNEANFSYSVDKRDNILIFGTTGEMIGKINYWAYSDTFDRSWDA
ncbi:MAG: hypothetical protein ACKVKR_13525, partial [Pseudomonadales bacterium]